MTDRLSSPALDPDHADFGILLGLAYQCFVDALQAHLAERGFTDLGPSFGYVLRALAAQPLTATQLAGRLHLTPQGAAKIVDDMVRCGYVVRQADPSDGRARRLVLARRGQRELAEARAFHAAFEQRLGEVCGTERVALVRSTLEALIRDGDGPPRSDTASRLLRPL
jgi:MarR family transcriptional regulator for hemolysin